MTRLAATCVATTIQAADAMLADAGLHTRFSPNRQVFEARDSDNTPWATLRGDRVLKAVHHGLLIGGFANEAIRAYREWLNQEHATIVRNGIEYLSPRRMMVLLRKHGIALGHEATVVEVANANDPRTHGVNESTIALSGIIQLGWVLASETNQTKQLAYEIRVCAYAAKRLHERIYSKLDKLCAPEIR